MVPALLVAVALTLTAGVSSAVTLRGTSATTAAPLKAPPLEVLTAEPPSIRPSPPSPAPALVLRQPLLPLGLDDEGQLEVPATAGDIGLWRDGPAPGDMGPAVLVGHVDLKGKKGVFARLTALRPGQRVDVTRADGRVVSFRVTRTLAFPKNRFPTDEVYEPTDGSELRLITCGGSVNRLTGRYRDNVVVFATRL